jgi:hypothetical protein
MIIKVAFYKGRGRLRDRFIRWYTNSPYSHVELVLPDDKGWIGIYPPDSPRVRKNTLNNNNEYEWDSIEFEITRGQLDSINDFYELTNNQSYDWVGMILSHTLPFQVKRINKWYCSEWVAYALALSGVIDWKSLKLYNRANIPPNILYNILTKERQFSSKVIKFRSR